MRTKVQEEAVNVEAVLNDAEREELAELRAERAARDAEKVAAEKAAELNLHKIRLDLPAAAGMGVQVGGRMYYNGIEYTVSNDLKWVLEEAERRAWCHESSLHNSENRTRKPKNIRL